MAGTNRFFIKRNDIEVDDAVVESEGLTIGRLITNDLVLNHRTVSRTHAGVKEINGEYWIFNLSESNGTVVNGWLVDRTPLLDGDIVQMGPYSLLVNYVQGALSLTVQMDLDVRPVDGGTTRLLTPSESDNTVMIQIPVGVRKQEVAPPGGTQRFKGTGLFTSVLPALDEKALNVFWEKRKRE